MKNLRERHLSVLRELLILRNEKDCYQKELELYKKYYLQELSDNLDKALYIRKLLNKKEEKNEKI